MLPSEVWQTTKGARRWLIQKVRQDHRIVSQAVIVAIGVRETGEREILGFTLGAS